MWKYIKLKRPTEVSMNGLCSQTGHIFWIIIGLRPLSVIKGTNNSRDICCNPGERLPEIKVICVLDCRVMLIHLCGKLSFQFFCFFQVRSDFLFLPEFSVDTLSDKKKTKTMTGTIIVQSCPWQMTNKTTRQINKSWYGLYWFYFNSD